MASTADPIAYAAGSPEASLFNRHILHAAVNNSTDLTSDEIDEAKALLANVLMNDYLNWWNDAGDKELDWARDLVNQVLPSSPPPGPNPVLAPAYHARGLVNRALNHPDGALADFQHAVKQDPNFARAYAQIGNQTALNGDPQNSHQDFAIARGLAPNYSSFGYLDWGEGRAFFMEEKWDAAIGLLSQSVIELPTVWYNRLYLAAAQNNSTDRAIQATAPNTVRDFIALFGRGTLTDAKTALAKAKPGARALADAARTVVLNFIVQF
jgi:tetratricopeptide (TPR) repeat protein